MRTADSIIADVIAAEGDYTNNPADPGGPTRYGITQRAARQACYFGPMNELPRTLAEAIYRKRYINDPGFDKILAVDADLAAELIDTGVNMGPAKPAPWLQRALNALNLGGTKYPDIVVDGAIGPATVGALRALLAWRGADGRKVLLRVLNALQAVEYLEITERRPASEQFFYGWVLNRVEVV
jgi:lysozyme family protein